MSADSAPVASAVDVPAAALETIETSIGAVATVDAIAVAHLNRVARIGTSAGASVIVKHGAPAHLTDLYQREAEGLEAIRGTGVRTPDVLAIGADFLVLEDVGVADQAELDWEAVGRALATLHRGTAHAFGFPNDNYIGTLPQQNGWDADGRRFFAEKRLLALLESTNVQAGLSVEEIAGVERIATRVIETLDPQPPALVHGDFWLVPYENRWEGNLLMVGGEPVFIDPAISYSWAEADIANWLIYYRADELPDAFWGAYREITPLRDGTLDRIPLFQVHGLLESIHHTADDHAFREFFQKQLRVILDRFA